MNSPTSLVANTAEEKRTPTLVSDLDIMEANGAGMEAADSGVGRHDNPYNHVETRTAWDDGWLSATRALADHEDGR